MIIKNSLSFTKGGDRMKRELFYVASVCQDYWADVVFASFSREEVEGFRKKTAEEKGYYYPEPQSILVEVPEA